MKQLLFILLLLVTFGSTGEALAGVYKCAVNGQTTFSDKPCTTPAARKAESTSAEQPELRRYPLPKHGIFELKVPAAWKDQVRQPPNELPPTISFGAKTGAPFEVLVTPIWAMKPDMPAPGMEEMRRNVQAAADNAATQAIEKTIKVKELKGSNAHGYYFSATDRAPKPGEYKYMTQGTLGISDLVVTFTILTNDGQDSTVKVALSMLAGATHANVPLPATTAPQSESIEIQTTGSSYVLTVPVSRLTMAMPRGNLALKSNSIGGSTNNPRYFYFEDSALHLIVSGWFESASGFQGIETFWEGETKAWEQNGLPGPQDVSFVKLGNWDAIIYDVKQTRGANSHIRAHWVQAGTWIDIHFSLTSDRTSAESRKLLESLLRAISVSVKA